MDNNANTISAFVGRSFNEKDKELWRKISENLDPLRNIGFSWEDAEEAQAQPISEKVKQRIERNDIFIGILTKREAIYGEKSPCFRKPKPINWVTSYWVIQESGYAIGLGRKVIFIKEKGLDVTDGLNADFEYIEIDPSNPQQAITNLINIITTEISKKVGLSQIKFETISNEQTPSLEEQANEKDLGSGPQAENKFYNLMEALSHKDFSSAEMIYDDILEKQEYRRVFGQDDDGRDTFRAFYYALLYRNGQNDAINKIKEIADENPQNLNVINHLVRGYEFFDQYDDAKKIVEYYIERAKENSIKLSLSVMLSEINIKRNDYRQAKKNLASFFDKLDSNTPEQNFQIYKTLADIYKKEGDLDISCSLFEMALRYKPAESSIRFNLAYDYSKAKKNELSLYHYNAHLKVDESLAVLNNLGVCYGKLEINGKSVSFYKQGIEKGETLSNANLANLYISNGFYDEAKELLDQALQIKDHHKNVDSNMQTIKEKLEFEEKEEEKALENARKQRDFVLDFANAISIPFNNCEKIKGSWSSGYNKLGKFMITSISNNIIEGKYEYEYEGTNYINQKQQRIMNIKFSGELINRGFKYTIITKSHPKGSTYATYEKEEFGINGLGMLSEDGSEIRLISEKDGKYEFFTAKKELPD